MFSLHGEPPASLPLPLAAPVEAEDPAFRLRSTLTLRLSGAVRLFIFGVCVGLTWHAENIFLVGSINELKNWNPSDAIALNADNYPTWRGT